MSNAFKLKNGSILLSTEAPGGIYNASQLKAIANLCDSDSVMVKATEDQRLALLVAPEKANQIADTLKSIGLGIRHYQDGLHQPVSCIGEMCADFEQDALGSAMDISSELDGIKLNSPLKIGLNGCAKCCVPCHTLDVSIVGDMQGYRISLGGKTSQLPEMASFMAESVPATDLPSLVKNIVEIYKSDAQDGESLQELIDRNGAGKFIKALAPWSQDAAGSSDPSFEERSDDSTETLAEESTTEHTDSPDLAANIEDDNSIDHQMLAGEEAQISMEEDSMSTQEDENLEFNLSANDTQENNDTLGEISVSSEDQVDSLNVPIQAETDEIPEINMQELEIENSEVQTNTSGEEHFETVELADASSDELFEPEQFTADTSSFSNGIDLDSVPNLQSNIDPIEENLEEISAENPEINKDLIEEEAEAKLTAGIDAQQELIAQDQDEQETDRDASARLLESTSDNSTDEADELVSHHTEEVEFTSIDETSTPDSFEGGIDTSSYEIIEDHDTGSDDQDFDVNEHLPLSEVVATRKITPSSKSISRSTSWTIAGFDIDDSGLPVISWTNGVEITITSDAIANGHISMGGHDLMITQKNGGIQVEVDGLKLYLPIAA